MLMMSGERKLSVESCRLSLDCAREDKGCGDSVLSLVSFFSLVSSVLPIVTFFPAALPSVSINAKTSPTATIASFSKRISVIVPENGVGISLSTLSVATSTKVSSASTKSPTFLVQLMMVASEILSPILGILNSIIIAVGLKL